MSGATIRKRKKLDPRHTMGLRLEVRRGRAKEGRLRSQPPESVAKIAGLGLAGGAIVHKATIATSETYPAREVE
jgi:hypothetical protein